MAIDRDWGESDIDYLMRLAVQAEERLDRIESGLFLLLDSAAPIGHEWWCKAMHEEHLMTCPLCGGKRGVRDSMESD